MAVVAGHSGDRNVVVHARKAETLSSSGMAICPAITDTSRCQHGLLPSSTLPHHSSMQRVPTTPQWLV